MNVIMHGGNRRGDIQYESGCVEVNGYANNNAKVTMAFFELPLSFSAFLLLLQTRVCSLSSRRSIKINTAHVVHVRLRAKTRRRQCTERKAKTTHVKAVKCSSVDGVCGTQSLKKYLFVTPRTGIK